MAKREDYDRFSSLADKLQYLTEVHGSRRTRHFSSYEVELLNRAIKRLREDEDRNDNFNKLDREIQTNTQEQRDREKAIILLDQGMSNIVVSQVMGVSKSKVSKWKKDYIFSLFRKKGNSAKKISSKYRINYSIARKWRRTALGLESKKINANVPTSNATRNKTKKKAGTNTKRRKKRSKYSAKFQREAVRLIREGHTGAEVSKILGVNKETIRNWRKKHGLSVTTTSLSISLQNDVLDHIREGKSNSEISKLTGVSPTTVANWKRKFEKEGF